MTSAGLVCEAAAMRTVRLGLLTWAFLATLTSCASAEMRPQEPTAVSFSPLPSLPGVTYAGLVRVEDVRPGTLRVTPTMGSPSQLFVGRTVDLIFDGQVAAARGDCLFVEFVADAEPDGRHRVVSIGPRQAPDAGRCTG
jgi:hypothetical protein